MRTLVIALLPLFSLGCAKADGQIECPVAETGGAGMLEEGKPQIAAMGDRLGGGTENEIARAAAELRVRYPKASRGALVNYLISARCPRINSDAALDKAQKQHSLLRFSQAVEKAVPAS